MTGLVGVLAILQLRLKPVPGNWPLEWSLPPHSICAVCARAVSPALSSREDVDPFPLALTLHASPDPNPCRSRNILG